MSNNSKIFYTEILKMYFNKVVDLESMKEFSFDAQVTHVFSSYLQVSFQRYCKIQIYETVRPN